MSKSNEELWLDAKCAALRVDFLTTHEELHLYASSIYLAMMWAKKHT